MRWKLLMCIAGCAMGMTANVFAAGSASAAFLRLGIGAKNVAMGETGAAGNDITAVYWNPAGLNGIAGRNVAFMHAVWFDDISFQNVLYAQKLKHGAVGVSGTYLSMSGIVKYDNTGAQQSDSYKPADMALWISYARLLNEVPVGMNLKYVSSQIDGNTAAAVAADAGILLKPVSLAGRDMQIGLVVQNIGSRMKFRNDSFALPLNLKAGASYSFSDNATAALDVNKPFDTDLVGNAGFQYRYPVTEAAFIAGRAGYRTNTKGLGGIAGFTGGLGFGYNGIDIDYAYVPYGDLDDTHRISLKYSF